MNRIVFIRHGATAGNLKRRYTGRTDEPLSSVGTLQAERLRDRAITIDRLFASPMLRTRQTAEIVFPGVPYELVEDFREMDFGVFEGRTALEMRDDPQYKVWVDSWCEGPVPGGEAPADFRRRIVNAFLKSASGFSEGESIGIVAHGGTIMSLVSALSEPPCGFYDIQPAHCEPLYYVYDNGKLYREGVNRVFR
ncbi:MAG: histidine phosphatase family protein [Oscillospiraceae bacterium]|nr:histidine phosphatase family protein [Oscillospiraceae bacterium]